MYCFITSILSTRLFDIHSISSTLSFFISWIVLPTEKTRVSGQWHPPFIFIFGKPHAQKPLISSLFSPLYFATLDINTTVSTWLECSVLMFAISGIFTNKFFVACEKSSLILFILCISLHHS